jgi:UPF0716 protein FxsA
VFLPLVVAAIAVPLIELYVIAQVGHAIGLPLTLLLLFGVSLVGGVFVRRQGLRAWRELRVALAAGRWPGRQVADGALLLVGGALLVTPGFVTDAVGLLLVLPGSRGVARRILAAVAARRVRRQRVRVIDLPRQDWR